MNGRLGLLVFLWSLNITAQATFGETQFSPSCLVGAKKRISANVVDYERRVTAPVSAAMLVLPDGRLRDIRLVGKSKNIADNFAILEAVYASSPVPWEPLKTSNPHGPSKTIERPRQLNIEFGFGNKGSRSHKNRNHESQKGASVALHLIPADVLTRYPGLFSASEIGSKDNIYMLQTEGLMGSAPSGTRLSNRKVLEFFSSWEKFFANHRSASREEVLALRDSALRLLED